MAYSSGLAVAVLVAVFELANELPLLQVPSGQAGIDEAKGDLGS